MNRNFTNEIFLSKLPIFTSIPCSYPYPCPYYPYPSTSYPYPGTDTGTQPAGCSTLLLTFNLKQYSEVLK